MAEAGSSALEACHGKKSLSSFLLVQKCTSPCICYKRIRCRSFVNKVCPKLWIAETQIVVNCKLTEKSYNKQRNEKRKKKKSRQTKTGLAKFPLSFPYPARKGKERVRTKKIKERELRMFTQVIKSTYMTG